MLDADTISVFMKDKFKTKVKKECQDTKRENDENECQGTKREKDENEYQGTKREKDKNKCQDTKREKDGNGIYKIHLVKSFYGNEMQKIHKPSDSEAEW